MLRLASYDIVFQEIPGEVTLALNLSGCPNRCEGCHSPHLRGDVGQPLDDRLLAGLLDSYGDAVTCVCFMGGDAEPAEVERLALFVREYAGRQLGTDKSRTVNAEAKWQDVERISRDASFDAVDVSIEAKQSGVGISGDEKSQVVEVCVPRLKTAWYSGREVFPDCCSTGSFNYVKLGPYIPACGGLRSCDTNQRMYKILHGGMVDITWMFNR